MRDIFTALLPDQLSHHALYSCFEGQPATATGPSSSLSSLRPPPTAAAMQAQEVRSPSPPDAGKQDAIKLQTLALAVELVYAQRFSDAADQDWVRRAIGDGLGACSANAADARGGGLDLSEPGVARIGNVYLARNAGMWALG